VPPTQSRVFILSHIWVKIWHNRRDNPSHHLASTIYVKKTAFLISIILFGSVMLPLVFQGHQSQAAFAAAMATPTHTSTTMPTGYVLHLPCAVAHTAPSLTPTPTYTPTQTSSAVWTPTPTGIHTPTATPTPTFTPTATDTANPTLTYTPTPSPTPTLVPLIIGHITDIHIGWSWIYSQRLPYVLNALNQQAQVMVDTGDCAHHGSVEETVEYMDLVTRNISIPWRATPGNHDTPRVFERYIGPLEWSWDVGGYRLIGINTEAINYTSLDQALTHDKPCIVFGHFPLSYCAPADQAELRQRFGMYRVPVYIAGHIHVDTLETDRESGTILLTGQPGGMGYYRLITLRGFAVESINFESTF